MSALGVLSLAHEMIRFRERVDADQIEAVYLIDGKPVVVTVTAQAVAITTDDGVAGAVEVDELKAARARR